jgi:hypothetical protein
LTLPEYTPHYHLGIQTDTSERFDMSVITDTVTSIDTILYNKQDVLTTAQQNAVDSGITADILSTIKLTKVTSTITSLYLEDITTAVLVGTIDSAIHGTDDTFGVVRSYAYTNNKIIQIAEFCDGVRKTRYLEGGIWSNWI